MNKIKITEWLAIFLCVTGVGLIYVCVFLKPYGVIDDSILWAIGQMFTLIGALTGVGVYYNNKIDRIETKIRENFNNEEKN